jgi:predicted YcjX-like family ATPase
MEQNFLDWAIEARANGNRTDQPDDLAARWLDLADDLDALIKAVTPNAAKD